MSNSRSSKRLISEYVSYLGYSCRVFCAECGVIDDPSIVEEVSTLPHESRTH
jgi:hypothetical protein